MPIFEYKCQDCGTSFEKLIRRTGNGEQVSCPSCGKDHVSQQLSTFAAHAGSSGKPGVSDLPCGNRCPHPGMCGMN
jgi:putative FmdB family regulatory protein